MGIKLVYTDAMHAKACTVPAAAMSKVSKVTIEHAKACTVISS